MPGVKCERCVPGCLSGAEVEAWRERHASCQIAVEKQIADLIRDRDALALRLHAADGLAAQIEGYEKANDALALRLHAAEAENAALRERSVPEGWHVVSARRDHLLALLRYDGPGAEMRGAVVENGSGVRIATGRSLRAACEAADKAVLNAAGSTD